MRYNTERHDGGRTLLVIIFILSCVVTPTEREERALCIQMSFVCGLL